MLERTGSTGPRALAFIQQYWIIRAVDMQAKREIQNIISNTLYNINKFVICKFRHKKLPVTPRENVL